MVSLPGDMGKCHKTTKWQFIDCNEDVQEISLNDIDFSWT